jgi:sugar lactone lactonase YvrE
MMRRYGRTIVAAAAAAVAFVAGSGAVEAVTAPVSHPRIVAHFSLSAGQTPEDIALEPDAAVDVSFAKADQVARVTRGGQVDVLGQLPASGSCPVIGFPVSAGIARAGNGTIYVIDCTGNADTGVWRLRDGSAPVQIAQLPANSFPNDMALDGQTGDLYITDSLLGVVWKVPTRGGGPSVWATGPALQRSSFFGANGIAVHDHAVWVSNSDQGTIVKIPIRADGSAGTIQPMVTGLTGGVDNFTVLGSGDTILATLDQSSQVILIRPASRPQVVLSAMDGLSNPTDIAVRHDTIYVTNAAYFTFTDPNLLIAHLHH